MRKVAISALLVAALAACALFGRVFEKPRLTFRGIEPRQATFSELKVDVILDVENPNSIELAVARGEITLSVEGARLAVLQPQRGLRARPRATTTMRIPGRIQYLDAVTTASAFHHQRSARFRMDGSVGLDTPVGVIDIPVAEEGELPLPALPDVAFESAAIHNPNPVPLWLDAVRGRLLVSKAEIATVTTADLGEIAPGATRQWRVPMHVSLVQAPAVLAGALQGDMRVGFEGWLRSGDGEVPLSLETMLKRH